MVPRSLFRLACAGGLLAAAAAPPSAGAAPAPALPAGDPGAPPPALQTTGGSAGRLADTAAVPHLVVYVARGCPHCARAEAWIEEELLPRRPGLVVRVRDVADDPNALAALRELARAEGLAGVSVPTFVVGGAVRVGFDAPATTGVEIEGLLGATGRPEPPARVRLPLVGEVGVREVGLPAFTVAVGLLDGFNPCAMWVLLFLLSMLVRLRSRARMALVAGVFVLASGAVYYAFMAAWLNAFVLLGMARWIQITLGGAALLMGGINVKDFFWLGRGPSLAIPERAKPAIYERVRRVVEAPGAWTALGAVAALAVLVNTVELLCTAGLPALYTRVLTLQDLSWWSYHGYLLLYDAAYMLDDALMVSVAVVTLSHHRLQRGEARWLKLASGLVMVALGLLLVLRPDWLAAVG